MTSRAPQVSAAQHARTYDKMILWRERARLLDKLLAAYRIGRPPSEATLSALAANKDDLRLMGEELR